MVEPAHIKRLKGTMYVLTNFVQQNDDGSSLGRMSFLLGHLADELADELAEYDETAIRIYMFKIGQVISWIGHGDDSQLPEDLLPFARLITGQPEPSEPETVTAEVVELNQ